MKQQLLIKQILNEPRFQLAVFLLLFFFTTISHLEIRSALVILFTCIVSVLVFDVGFSYLKTKKITPPYSALVTGLIITLIVDPSLSILQISGLCFFAIASKYFIQIGSRHLFNPTAFAFLTMWFLNGTSPSWWAATQTNSSVSNLFLYGLLFCIFYISGIKYRRYYTIFSYLISLFVLFEIFFSKMDFFILTSIGVLFFALTMLPEPKTSPIRPRKQALYGLATGVFTVMLVYASVNSKLMIFDTFITALLLGNLLFFKYR